MANLSLQKSLKDSIPVKEYTREKIHVVYKYRDRDLDNYAKTVNDALVRAGILSDDVILNFMQVTKEWDEHADYQIDPTTHTAMPILYLDLE
jgi:Holliday junction resolvase RusA-like endonuclease